MGDLNDSPFNNSVKKMLETKGKNEVEPFGIYNPLEKMAKKGIGTIAFRDAWDIFDQMIVSESLKRRIIQVINIGKQEFTTNLF